MKTSLRHLLLPVFLLLPLSSAAALKTGLKEYSWHEGHFSVPLEIRDNSGVERIDWPVTSGVPLPYGIVYETKDLRLTDTSGKEIPCQFTVLSRYAARDNSIRWVLLDLQVSLTANSVNTYTLRNDQAAQVIDNPINIKSTADFITVATGDLSVIVPRNNGHLVEKVTIAGDTILNAKTDDGASIHTANTRLAEHYKGRRWNTHGWEPARTLEKINIAESGYYSTVLEPRDVQVELAGPMRSVIVIRGRHFSPESGPGIRKGGFYNFTTRLHFYRNNTFVKVEHSIDNSERSQPQWNLPFHSSTLNHSLELKQPVTVTGGGKNSLAGKVSASTTRLPPGKSAALIQAAGHVEENKAGRKTIFPETYAMGISREGKVDNPVSEGKLGRFLDISDADKGVAVAIRYMWEEAPRKIAFSDNTLEISLHADKRDFLQSLTPAQQVYDLDFGERYIHDILYYFHQSDAETARVADVAEAFEYPLIAYAPPAWYADTGAWYFEVGRSPEKLHRKVDPDSHWQTDSIGFRDHGQGSPVNYNSGGHHESLNSGWLYFIRSGALNEFERKHAQSRWTIAHNPGWAYRNNDINLDMTTQEFGPLDKAYESWNRLTAYGPKDFYLWRSEETYQKKTRKGDVKTRYGGNTYLNKYKWLPDHEHYALLRLFEYYFIFGDMRALDAIHGFVNWDINFQYKHLFKGRTQPLTNTDYFREDPNALRRGHYSRVYTWMLYTNLTGFNATANPTMDFFARWQIRRLLTLLRHRHGQLTRWKREAHDDIDTHATDNTPVETTLSSEKHPGSDDVDISSAQTWMEAQGVLALHEAYKTYGDERILDGLWAQADYFSHHVPYFPELGMLDNRTQMPNRILGLPRSLTPGRHDRHVQMWPVIYHYTGWPEILERYQQSEQNRKGIHVNDWFLQTGLWERETVAKSSTRAPNPITDLEAVSVERDAITLAWTSPGDDDPTGRAERYFVKYSDKPIEEFAPTDNPERSADKLRVIREAENQILEKYNMNKLSKKRAFKLDFSTIKPEPEDVQRWHPDWHRINAFWMAEHVANEPAPGPAGSREVFTIRELRPHNWFGLENNPTVNSLKPGTYYFAICSWDQDRNLSRLSNVIQIDIP